MNIVYKIIITYEIIFIIFWNLLYLSNSEVENWFAERFLSALFVFLSKYTKLNSPNCDFIFGIESSSIFVSLPSILFIVLRVNDLFLKKSSYSKI